MVGVFGVWETGNRAVSLSPPLSTAGEDRVRYRGRDHHAAANPGDDEAHPVDVELARRLSQSAIDRRVRAAQRRLVVTERPVPGRRQPPRSVRSSGPGPG